MTTSMRVFDSLRRLLLVSATATALMLVYDYSVRAVDRFYQPENEHRVDIQSSLDALERISENMRRYNESQTAVQEKAVEVDAQPEAENLPLTLHDRVTHYMAAHQDIIQRNHVIRFKSLEEALVTITILSEGEVDTTIDTYLESLRSKEYVRQWTGILNVMHNRAEEQGATLADIANSGQFHGVVYNPKYKRYFWLAKQDFDSVPVFINEDKKPNIDYWKLASIRGLYWLLQEGQLEDITCNATYYAHPLDRVNLKVYAPFETVKIGNHTYLATRPCD